MAMNYKQCPKCASKNTLKFLYGMPTHEAIEQAEAGKIKLGGCCVIVGGPEYYCNDCENEWNKKQATEAAYERIKGLKASVGGYFGGSYSVEVDLTTGSISWHYWDRGKVVDMEFKTTKEATVKKIIEELRVIDLLNWKREYKEPGVLDGTNWSVEIIRNGRNIKKYGENKYPDDWKAFCKLVRKITGKSFS
ncbi:MAG: hypothetical protein LRY71_15145 [Bacillaceae bacterium]|nr:hypothetical protein [Bacillaceae bacterium]